MGKKQLKQRISYGGAPYTIWQTRTHYLCIALVVWAVAEVATGAGFLTLGHVGIFDLQAMFPSMVLGFGTVISGVINLVVAALGFWGAYDPRKSVLFFWATFLNALLLSWQAASLISRGQFDPLTFASLAISLVFAVCAWNVRGQTGYFNNHPRPEE